MADRVLVEVDRRGIATVWLNRPEVNNAYDDGLIAALSDAVGRLEREPGVRALLLRGKGKHFQAGADLKFLRRLIDSPPAVNQAFSAATVAAMRALQAFPRPVVPAAVTAGVAARRDPGRRAARRSRSSPSATRTSSARSTSFRSAAARLARC